MGRRRGVVKSGPTLSKRPSNWQAAQTTAIDIKYAKLVATGNTHVNRLGSSLANTVQPPTYEYRRTTEPAPAVYEPAPSGQGTPGSRDSTPRQRRTPTDDPLSPCIGTVALVLRILSAVSCQPTINVIHEYDCHVLLADFCSDWAPDHVSRLCRHHADYSADTDRKKKIVAERTAHAHAEAARISSMSQCPDCGALVKPAPPADVIVLSWRYPYALNIPRTYCDACQASVAPYFSGCLVSTFTWGCNSDIHMHVGLVSPAWAARLLSTSCKDGLIVGTDGNRC